MAKQESDNFRDSIGTISEDGKRAWVFPKIPSGRFYKYRKLVSYVLLAFLILSPFIKVNGNQFLMFNVLERRFNIFGFPFWPQDFHLFVISMIIGVIFIALFTVAFGRIFCGWICPQTIFMEMVFRRIEFWIDGDRSAQMRLDRQPWTSEKIRKRVTKWIIFFIISFIIANVFLAYLIGSDRLIQYITDGPLTQQFSILFLPGSENRFALSLALMDVCKVYCWIISRLLWPMTMYEAKVITGEINSEKTKIVRQWAMETVSIANNVYMCALPISIFETAHNWNV